MKKLIIALVLGLGLGGFVQEATAQQKKATTEKSTPEQRQKKYLAHLTKELNLDAKQQEAVGKILAEKGAKVQDLKAKKDAKKATGEKLTDAEKAELKNKLKAEKADTEAKMKAVLSADQYEKWLVIRQENRENMKWK